MSTINDWTAGDLVTVTRTQNVAATNMEHAWPKVFRTAVENAIGLTSKDLSLQAGTVVMALDARPSTGQFAYVRVLYQDLVVVINSNFLLRK